jgi:hypothetical protein
VSDAGLDYSAAYRGTFDLHVDWSDVETCRVVSGPRGKGRFWCVEAKTLESPTDAQQGTHLLAFGTPVALDLDLARGAPESEVDARVRAWTDGRCTQRPPAEPPKRRRRWWPQVEST